jgi:hypothetical protein
MSKPDFLRHCNFLTPAQVRGVTITQPVAQPAEKQDAVDKSK